MRQRYSTELIQEAQRVLSKKAGFAISEDQAVISLDALARLGEVALRVLDLRDNQPNDKSDAIDSSEF